MNYVFFLNVILFILFIIRAYRRIVYLNNNNTWQWLITFPKRKLNLTITILTILRNDIFTIFPLVQNPPHYSILEFRLYTRNSYETSSQKYNIYIYKTNYITNSRSNIIPLYLEFHSIPRENITPITQNPIKQIITNSIEHRSKIPFHKIQISHLEFQPYTFKTLAKRHPVAKAGRKQRPILFRPASRYFYFFPNPPRSLTSLSLAFPDTTQHRCSRFVDRFNIGLGNTYPPRVI